ncbi:MAG TPA: MCE family protein [Jatrophihabitans sp.]|jgi:phospholipid/cholesterol/gamma-HCH transport system substrate-binding protein|uniref:MCE family protein n=1 Tax=Jatrophihabitans sp. TaxID=1932789 RepID=UPI002E0661C0|nr:MCE family protein [Jatrophihabitans sp.]
MLRRSTKFQLILFVVITLLGVSYVSAEYVGLTKSLFGNNGCVVKADFPDSGGIFTNAEVTYRGVTVGKVGELHLIKDGVRVDLNIDNCSSPKIPISSRAVITDRSVVGEQYVNLIPPNGNGPFAHGNNVVIPMQRNGIPTATKTLLVNLDRLVRSVDLDNLRTTVSELNKAVNGRGPDLGSLLDATDQLLQSALDPQNVDNTIALIDTSSSVLQTQLDEQQPLQSWTHSLNLLSQQLKTSDPDIRHLFDTGPGDLGTVSSFIRDNRTDLGVTLANLSTVGQIIVRHLDGVEQVLELYPALAAGGQTALHDRRGALGLVLQTTPDPQDCGDPKQNRQGYNGVRREPANLSPIAPNVGARCTAPVSSGTNVRGSANIPGGDPISTAGGGYAYPRVVTSNLIGTSLTRSSSLGDASWLTLLTDALH